jgi:hypothetical protein
MLKPDVIERIRSIFLHEGSHVSLTRATALFGWSESEMSEAIRAGEIEVTKTSICREELWAKALEVWSLEAIEEALGSDADRVLPPSRRLTDLHVRVPRFHIDMLEHVAGREQTSVSEILTRELDDLASANAEDLAVFLPGFERAVRWPTVSARD